MKNCQVDYLEAIQQALEIGYPSVMVDGSRLELEANIAATASGQAGACCRRRSGGRARRRPRTRGRSAAALR
jgi:hypothetical protein